MRSFQYFIVPDTSSSLRTLTPLQKVDLLKQRQKGADAKMKTALFNVSCLYDIIGRMHYREKAYLILVLEFRC